MNDEAPPAAEEPYISRAQYITYLKKFDTALCDAIAVGQASSGRLETPHVGHATHVFARICSHATSLIRAAPKSRWISSDSEHWDFGAIAGHARAIIEGYLLFMYVAREPDSVEEWMARINVMHLNDCSKRIQVLTSMAPEEEIAGLNQQAEEIRDRLRSNSWFTGLDQKLQRKLLQGEYLTIASRDEQLDALGIDRATFYTFWHILSQYTHVLPLSFYRMEPNGRGTGIENDTDRGYLGLFLNYCADILAAATDRMVELFPDVASVRKGLDSKFAPGPRRNLPKAMKRRR